MDTSQYKKAKQEIINAIETMVDKKCKDLLFDQTYSTIITKKTNYSTDQYIYTVQIGQNQYTITTKAIYSVGDKIRVKVPLGNWSEVYIEGKIF